MCAQPSPSRNSATEVKKVTTSSSRKTIIIRFICCACVSSLDSSSALRPRTNLLPRAQSWGDQGLTTKPRWAAFQQVHVILYPGHFTDADKQAIRDVLNQFQAAGANQNCSNVSFVDITEASFYIPPAG